MLLSDEGVKVGAIAESFANQKLKNAPEKAHFAVRSVSASS